LANVDVAAPHHYILVCTTGDTHLVGEIEALKPLYQHYATSAEPIMLGFECHATASPTPLEAPVIRTALAMATCPNCLITPGSGICSQLIGPYRCFASSATISFFSEGTLAPG
jgi:hypothetical protein